MLGGFAELEFTAERFCVMVRHRVPDRKIDTGQVQQVDWATYWPAQNCDRVLGPEPSDRGAGTRRQVVAAALTAVLDVPFVFLVAALDDWPQHFYGRLGFDTVGIESRFMRHPVRSS